MPKPSPRYARAEAGASLFATVADREEIAARSNPKFPQTATGTVNLDGHGKAEAGFKISKHFLAMELTEWGVQDIWNQNKPDEVMRCDQNIISVT
jgi:hypothetical protein